MLTRKLLTAAAVLAPLMALTSLTGCEEKKPVQNPATSTKADGHSHDHGPGDDHGHADESGHGHGGAVIALGEQTIGTFTAKATRDEGQIVAGKDAPIDVTITPADGATAKVAAVRLWIGSQDAKGSVKAKAEVEDPNDPNRWHVHAEIPNPMPADSRLWIEIESESGQTSVGGFDLHR